MYCSFSKIHKMIVMCIYIALIYLIPMAKGAVPGTFFWKPRLGLDLSIPPTAKPEVRVALLNKQNIQDGLCVLVDGYKVGVTLIAIVTSLSTGPSPHLNPTSAYFYTNAYRWALRFISLVPFCLAGNGGRFCETHRLWKRRYYYMDEFMPQWLQSALFYVKKEEWEQEALEYKRFKKYSESAFVNHYNEFPRKKFESFESQFTLESKGP